MYMCIRFESPFRYASNSVFNYHLLSQHQLRGVYTRRHTHLKPKIAGGSVNPQHKECSIRTKAAKVTIADNYLLHLS